MPKFFGSIAAAIAVTVAAVTPAQALSQRTFVASTGLDTNPCSLPLPCRTFGAAIAGTSSGGEVVILDSAGYGPVSISKSISITAPPGIYAGISVLSGVGITVSATGAIVKLSGLTINGQGGTTGVYMTTSGYLVLENCIISNFAGTNYVGIYVTGPASVTVTDSKILNNYYGAYFDGGSTGEIAHSLILGNTQEGVHVNGSAVAAGTGVAIEDSEVSQNYIGLNAVSTIASSRANIAIIRSQIFTNIYGAASQSTAGTSYVTMTASFLMGNVTGLYQYQAGGSATVESFGDNSAQFDTTPLLGTLTTRQHF